MGPEAGDAHEYEIDGDDVTQKTRDHEDQNARYERDERLQQNYIHGHWTVSLGTLTSVGSKENAVRNDHLP
jgi:hypothetical protein